MNKKIGTNLLNTIFFVFGIAMLIAPIRPEFTQLGQGFSSVAILNLLWNNVIKK
jgi:hypothetical protein